MSKIIVVSSLFLLVLFSYLYLLDVIPFYRGQNYAVAPKTGAEADKEELNVSIVYLDCFNKVPEIGKIVNVVKSYSPMILLLQRVGAGFSAQTELDSYFPFRVDNSDESGNNIFLFSKIPIGEDRLLSIGDFLPPVIVADLQLSKGRSFTFAAFQTCPEAMSRSNCYFFNRLIFRRLAAHLKTESRKNLIVAGHLNVTPFSGFYRMFTRYLKLKNTRHGHGMDLGLEASFRLIEYPKHHLLFKRQMRSSDFEILDRVLSVGQGLYANLELFVNPVAP